MFCNFWFIICPSKLHGKWSSTPLHNIYQGIILKGLLSFVGSKFDWLISNHKADLNGWDTTWRLIHVKVQLDNVSESLQKSSAYDFGQSLQTLAWSVTTSPYAFLAPTLTPEFNYLSIFYLHHTFSFLLWICIFPLFLHSLKHPSLSTFVLSSTFSLL